MIYDPPCTYRLPDWLANRIRNQGLNNTEPVLSAQVTAETNAGHAAMAAIMTTYYNVVHTAARPTDHSV